MMNILICLIGSNPLPNYVVSKYLMMEERDDNMEIPVPDKVFFLHSTDTEKYAKNIRNKIEQKNKVLLVNLGDNEREQEIIMKTITDYLDQISNITSIHLNYTGGTKPMAVHSYLAVLEYSKNNSILAISSDLNPKTYRIKINNGNEYPTKKNLRDIVLVKSKDILELHSMKIKKPGNENISYNINIENLKNNILDKNGIYTGIFNEIIEFEGKNFSKKVFIENTTKQDMKLLAIKYNQSILNNFKQLCSDFPFNSIEEMSKEEFIEFLEFIKGRWLEDYIQYRILLIKDRFVINEARRSLEAHYNQRPCEIDVVVTKGYEMYLFSCTISKKIQIVKGKAFEVMYRSTQLGGDHSKAIIVNLMPNKPSNDRDENNNEALEKDLSSFDAQSKIYIIGLDDIKDEKKLDLKLKQIFQG